ncbi:MAG: 1-deoxy-D-xylulose-5-phosphate reductoisomerase [Rikenellaceae bacterium]
MKITKNRICILGSTGSIGCQTLQIIEANDSLFEVEVLTSNSSWKLLAEQAIKYKPNSVVIAQEQYYELLKEALIKEDIKVYCGKSALEQVASSTTVDTVVSAIVGYAALAPTMSAIRAGKKIALANKETLVVAGELVMSEALKYKATIIPVDSEHSAIFQCLVGEQSKIDKIILTASGGPFRGYTAEELSKVGVEDALKHPNWVMGRKITIDSATLMNKGLEVIEARWLFDLKPEQIEVTVHPSSYIHSMVQFADGAIKAQLGVPDMRVPIQYALTFPLRLPLNNGRLSFKDGIEMSFSPADAKTFKCLSLAYRALEKGGSMPCVMNAANEVAVGAFLDGKIRFIDIPKYIEMAMDEMPYTASPTLEDYEKIDTKTRQLNIWKF